MKGESSSLPDVPPIPSKPLASPSASSAKESAAPKGEAALPSPPRGALPTQSSRARATASHRRWKQIEWAWTLIPVAMLLSVAGLTVGVLYNLDTGPTAYGATPNWYVNVTGQQFYWSFTYTSPYAQEVFKTYNVTNESSVLWIPQNAVVWLNVTSVDVVHSFNIPQLGVRIDAIPGRINHYWFTIPQGAQPGQEYLIQCTEFCGQGHYSMIAYVMVGKSSGLLPPN